MKHLAFVHRNDTRFAVGDFSPVLSVFSHLELGSTVSPFLLLDHIGPGRLLPSTRRQGVNEHPHRGFETVTLVYAGEIEHRDSTGGGGVIGAGDVQWMTAAAGVVHRELFSEAFTQRGGRFEMIQLWVNLPAADKLGAPRYQSLARAAIPVVTLADGESRVRVIAGTFADRQGPALTHTRMNVLDVELAAGGQLEVATEDGDTALVYLRSGRLQFAPEEPLEEQGLAVLSNAGNGFPVTAMERSRLLVLTGARIDEPINGHGPFVMNSYEEILQAYEDVRNGTLGAVKPAGE
ncbi:MAG: pirin [Moraxellaceae bacterium]|jgi:redox-sensitive bicupin YhaK (pirin superfamily)|nr:pirin [Moraxellaceae bacterium]